MFSPPVKAPGTKTSSRAREAPPVTSWRSGPGLGQQVGARWAKPAGRTPSESGGEALSLVHEVLRSPGQPLDADTLRFMEPRFGHNFSDVRVHADPSAERSAQAVQARAYTVGRHIVFGAGQYAAHSPAGRSLLAHELTHTVQQGVLSRMMWKFGLATSPEDEAIGSGC